MNHEVETQWMGKMQFNSLVNGHTIIMDAPERGGGEDVGPIPKPLVLTALSGCTGMEVIAMLRKKGKPVDELDIRVSGELSREKPIAYTAVHVVFDIRGPEDSREAALEAVDESLENMCGVSHMLKKAMPVTWEASYNGEPALISKNEITDKL